MKMVVMSMQKDHAKNAARFSVGHAVGELMSTKAGSMKKTSCSALPAGMTFTQMPTD